MVFSDTTKKDGILQKCELYIHGGNYGSITNNPTLLNVFTSLVNDSMDTLVTDILDSDTSWQWDDTNRTDFPIGQLDLVQGQRDYTLDVSHLKILGVEAKDESGDYYMLRPIDLQDLRDRGITPTEFYDTNGKPKYYDKIANSIMIYPQPDAGQVTMTNGLKVHFQRGPEYFLSTDTTKEPGFASVYHQLVPLRACLIYAMSNDMQDKVSNLNFLIKQKTDSLKRFMQKRGKDKKPKLTVKRINSK